ncbi:hypothetical protein NE237_021495 [Protea cynaroides]|uniref:Uncharacterized protein n=1 Tax=Protea cynaroides TaxID=273540 RepID=A0A9Q0HBD4_9MAGN|nr:hypothetical protein NE237_021495 [Protea cynaroides]
MLHQIWIRGRVNKTFCSGPGARSDLSTLIGHPLLGRGRGAEFAPGSSVETLDFASPLAPQVTAPPQSTTMEILTGLWMLPTGYRSRTLDVADGIPKPDFGCCRWDTEASKLETHRIAIEKRR